MVILVIGMLFYQYLLVRPDIKKMMKAADVVVLLLALLSTVSFFRDVSAYQAYIKVLSAFLLYFMGRLYYDRLLECEDALSLSAYLIVYLNFIHRLITFGAGLFKVTNAQGDLYYYDTDLAYAMILAFIFIGMFARNSLFKFFTMFFVCTYMVFFSDAGIQMILFVAVALVMLMYVLEVALGKKTIAMALMGLLIAGLLACVVLVYLPLCTSDSSGTWALFGDSAVLDMTHMESRYAEWSQVFDIRKPQAIPEILFGLSFNTVMPLKSFYLKTYFATGAFGLVLGAVFMILTFMAARRGQERKSFYVTVMLAILMLGSGVTVNTMETTQMSWYVMLFAGMAVSAAMENE